MIETSLHQMDQVDFSLLPLGSSEGEGAQQEKL